MFFKLALSACLVAVALSQGWGEEKKPMEQDVMVEKKEQYEKYQKYQEFQMFKAKLAKMHEMQKKKAAYEEFLEFKKHKEEQMKQQKQGEDDVPSQGLGEEKKKMEGGMNEFKKWAMAEKKEQYEKYQKYQEFQMFKDKLVKMHEMEKKKALYEEFLEFKKNKEQQMKQGNNEEDDDDDDTVKNEMKEHAEQFESAIKSFQAGNEKMAMMVTKSFLEMCKCQNDMGAELMMMLKKSDSDKSGMGDMFKAEMPDFMGNMTAKAHFLQKLQPEQRQKMMVYGLVKSMCSGAKTFILHAKAFEQTYMSSQSTSNSTAMIN